MFHRRELLRSGGLWMLGAGALSCRVAPDSTTLGESMTSLRLPTAFIPHGGGPWPVLPLPALDPGEARGLSQYMRSIAQLPARRPAYLLVVSAHWEAPQFTVHAGQHPGLLFDYYGMPPEAYTLQWPAPGAPDRAARVAELLSGAGFAVAVERERGFDHGTFIPLMLAYPEADLPVVQVSLKQGLDPAEHYALGRALAPLRDEGAFILGSGNSYHNLPRFFRSDLRAREEAAAFDAWLNQAVCAAPPERERLLTRWTDAPAARACHPREEHLIPLLVAAGAAADDAGRVGFQGTMGQMKISAHHFG